MVDRTPATEAETFLEEILCESPVGKLCNRIDG